MRILRTLVALISLMSSSVYAATTPPSETCQKMVLSLLDTFDASHQTSKEQLIHFADKCMPESALNNRPPPFHNFQLSEKVADRENLPVRM